MSSEYYEPSKIFTVDQANATLPLVRAITSDIVRLARDMIDRKQRLDHLTAGRDMTAGNPYDEELAQIERELEKDAKTLRAYVEELRQLGVEPKGLSDGLIDFPAMMDGRVVYLCWKHGEPEVLHWHELEGGFGGRQPLTASVASGGDSDAAFEV